MHDREIHEMQLYLLLYPISKIVDAFLHLVVVLHIYIARRQSSPLGHNRWRGTLQARKMGKRSVMGQREDGSTSPIGLVEHKLFFSFLFLLQFLACFFSLSCLFFSNGPASPIGLVELGFNSSLPHLVWDLKALLLLML